MSEQAAEGPVGELAPQGDSAFANLMDTLVGEGDSSTPRQGDGQVAAPDATGDAAGGRGDGPAGRPTAGDPAAPGAGPARVAGDGGAGGSAAPGGDGAAAGDAEQSATGAGAGDLPAGWTASAADLIPRLGQLSTAFEENTTKAYQATALETVKTEHVQYFDALKQHPRLLVGKQVPAIGGEGMETLRDTADAREWQEAVKTILSEEVRDRASRAMEENRDFMTTVHSSIELFQNNADLVPGTRDFDLDLANRFVGLAKPYELRVDGKLQGYSVPVQPIIDHLRSQVVAERATRPAPPAAAGASAAPARQHDPPQAGVSSKAGSSDAVEDFSTLFGTIGLPNLKI